jgi:hypothetical protein
MGRPFATGRIATVDIVFYPLSGTVEFATVLSPVLATIQAEGQTNITCALAFRLVSRLRHLIKVKEPV